MEVERKNALRNRWKLIGLSKTLKYSVLEVILSEEIAGILANIMISRRRAVFVRGGRGAGGLLVVLI
jgi:hypothetical protein